MVVGEKLDAALRAELMPVARKVFWWKLQLKGTPIVSRQMVGQWTLRAFLDHEPSPSSVASFTLERS